MPEIAVRITQDENAEFFGVSVGNTVNVDFEEYVAAVTASEIGESGMEACKAQAVAARSLAISRGALRGMAVSDDAQTTMAYRAARCDYGKYPISYRAAMETKGEVLMYGSGIAVAHFSANNGGRTTSSKERWGGDYPYLIEQDDPWDREDGHKKYGHGVGMSQRGARVAAKHGIWYRDILAFYYPGCTVMDNYGGLVLREAVHVTDKVLLNEKARDVVELAESKIGDPYVFGAWGQECTPETRKKYAGYHPEYKSKIYGECPVLQNKQKTCDGCKWQGHQCYDCRGFTHYVMEHGAGIDLYGEGCTTQYETPRNWEQRGKTAGMPNVVCCLFKYNSANKNYSHTGIHIGDGVIIHCTGNGGVKYGSLSDSTWTNYGIPKGLYTPEEIAEAGKVILMTTVKKGSSGDAVKQLQEWLNQLGYDCGRPDGIFGTQTDLAVKKFQVNHGLKADGIVGALTWNEIEKELGIGGDEEKKPANDDGSDDIKGGMEEILRRLENVSAELHRTLEQMDRAIADARMANMEG